MGEPEARRADDADDQSRFAVPGAPTYRPPVALVGAALWALALASLGVVAPFVDLAAVGSPDVETLTTVGSAFVGVAVFAVLFPLFAHLRLRPTE